jgi:hypothetical protein
MIVECGFHWIYPLEISAVQNRNEDFESNDQEDTVPPTSMLEVDETENLRYIIFLALILQTCIFCYCK